MARQKKGLRVNYAENVASYRSDGRTHLRSHLDEIAGDGWFIFVWRWGKWYALMDLRFIREKDALRGALALTAAGLDCIAAIEKAGMETVKQVACEFLQW
jgi:hypothetical protein